MWKIMYFKIFLGLLISFLLAKCLVKEEICDGLKDTIELRHELIDSLYQRIDSLYRVVDTLQWEKEIFDYNTISEEEIVSALIYVESGNNDSTYNSYEDAVGCLQIRKCMVDDVNRILRKNNKTVRFTYNDRWCRYKSINMFKIYCRHYNLVTAEEIARCWNGGPRGINNPATVGYWEKVKDKINS